MPVRFGFILVFLLAPASELWAQVASNQQSKNFPLRIHGFLMGNFTPRIEGDHPLGEEDSRFLWADERVRLEVTGNTANGSLAFLAKGDLFHDAVANKLDGTVREAYLDVSRGGFDLRLGREIVTWGVGDLVFINDVFPKDWAAFFSGRPLEYMKVGVDAAKLRMSHPVLNAEFVAIPRFEPDHLPNVQRFSFFDPFPNIRQRNLNQPAVTPGNAEYALRLYRRVLESDMSLYAYRGYWRQPSFGPDSLPQPTQLYGFYPRLVTFGASALQNFGAALLSLEAGYYDSLDDRAGTNPVIPNSQLRFLIGYQRQLANELALGMQYYVEILKEYAAYKKTLPAGFPMQDRARHLLTVRLTKFLRYQTWKLSLFSFYSPSDQDALVIPEVWHAFTDRLSVGAGANIFAGQRETTFLGQFDRNDNLYIVLRFDF
ncbi:MAG: hypothetical protein HY644_14630 [Acidobacteria bacterium]|nr:hypothetical protein [Acidobacteriota bacterium]